MKSYGIYQPALICDKCYLREVVYWLAFGRPPPLLWSVEGGPWRESDVRDGFHAPIPNDDFFEDNECRYAGISNDPRFGDSDKLVGYFNLDFIRDEIQELTLANVDDEVLQPLKEELAAIEPYELEVLNWKQEFSDYLDRFETEVLLDLQTGAIQATGYAISTKWLDDPSQIGNEQFWDLRDKEPVTIPKKAWTSKNVDWETCTLRSGDKSYIWIQMMTDSIFERYPPSRVLVEGDKLPLGTVYLAKSAHSETSSKIKLGRRSKNWDAFHVEVARRYAKSEMPAKKEAAIQELMDWFKDDQRQHVGRTSIGNKLKPYYDVIQKTEKKSG